MNKEEIDLLLETIETFSKDLIVENTKVTTLCFNNKEGKLLNNYIKYLQHQLKEKDKVIKKQSRIINQAYNNIESPYNWRKEHSTPGTIDVPLMTLCEEQLEILERGKNEKD